MLKRSVGKMVAVGLAIAGAVAVPVGALAHPWGGPGWHGGYGYHGGYYRGGYGYHGGYWSGGRWIAGAIVTGAVAGLVAGAVAGPPAYYAAPPVYYAPPPTVVYTPGTVVYESAPQPVVTTTTVITNDPYQTRYIGPAY
jgi:hypothetical protein